MSVGRETTATSGVGITNMAAESPRAELALATWLPQLMAHALWPKDQVTCSLSDQPETSEDSLTDGATGTTGLWEMASLMLNVRRSACRLQVVRSSPTEVMAAESPSAVKLNAMVVKPVQ